MVPLYRSLVLLVGPDGVRTQKGSPASSDSTAPAGSAARERGRPAGLPLTWECVERVATACDGRPLARSCSAPAHRARCPAAPHLSCRSARPSRRRLCSAARPAPPALLLLRPAAALPALLLPPHPASALPAPPASALPAHSAAGPSDPAPPATVPAT